MIRCARPHPLLLALPAVPLASLIGITAPASATPSTASTGVAAPVPGPASVTTLPTGERVWVLGRGRGARVIVRPAAPTGPQSVVFTRTTSTGIYVVPATAQPYLGRELDPELFNVTRAAANGGPVAVRMTYRGAAPAVPGVHLTSAAGGTASGYLTPASSLSFGRALAAKWAADQAGRPQRTSALDRLVALHPARTAARAAATEAAGGTTLTLRVTGADGKPQRRAEVNLFNLARDPIADDDATIDVPIKDGVGRVTVSRGDYSVVGFAVTPGKRRQVVRVVQATDVRLARRTGELRVDFRTARQPAVHVPRPARTSGYSLDLTRYGTVSPTPLDNAVSAGPTTDVFVAPVARAKVGASSVVQTWRLTGPGAVPTYTYDLAVRSDAIPASARYTFTDRQLGVVASAYYGDGTRRTGSFQRSALVAGEGPDAVTLGRDDVVLGTRRTEYVGARGGTAVWFEELAANGDSSRNVDDEALVTTLLARQIPAGARQTRQWLRGPLAPAVPVQGDDGGFCFTCAGKSHLGVALAAFTDTDPAHIGFVLPGADPLPVDRFRMYRGKLKLYDRDDSFLDANPPLPEAVVPVPPSKGLYRAVLDVDRRAQAPRLSTLSHTVLGFASAAGAGALPPTDWGCSASAFNCRVLPVLQARVALPTALDGSLPTGLVHVRVTAARVQHAEAATPTAAQLLVSYQGGDGWHAVSLKPAGRGRWSGTLDTRRHGGALADVRVTARDSGGSTFEQTVLRAFAVAAR